MERAGQLTIWNFACSDWQERLKAGQSLVPNLPLDHVEGQRAVDMFNLLRLPDVPLQPAMSVAAGDWQRDIVRAVFGSLIGGMRMVPEVFVLVPKKNSKTTGGAGIMLTALLMNKRPRAEFILVGPTQEVADLAFQQAAGMIEADEFLGMRFHVQEHLKTIIDRRSKAKLKIKTFDLKVMTGAKPAGILLDEVHLMSSMHFASRVIRQIRGGMIANPEAFLIMTTTQSDEPPAGAFRTELQYARGVRDGRIVSDVRTLPILYEFPEDVQRGPEKRWRNPKIWPQVLPNLGLSISIERLLSDYRTAAEKGEEEEQIWASQHLNVQMGTALHADGWAGSRYWETAARPGLDLDSLLDQSEVVVVGIDGGGLDDLLGLAVMGRRRGSREWLLWCHAWAHPDVFERRKDIAERLTDFVNDGSLTKCETTTQDHREVAELVAKIDKRGLLPERAAVGLDPVGVSSIVDELDTKGISSERLAAIGQGYRLTGSIWGAERKLKDGTLCHAGQALMEWCVGNARAEERGNAILITKQVSGKAKIDPLIAAFNAVELMGRNPEAVGLSVYEERGIMEIEI